MPKPPRSPKQIEASRNNGRLSRGPITAQGKYNSSQNSVRHQLLSTSVVLEKESPDGFLALLDALKQEYEPATTTQVLLVETMAVARWRTIRVWGAQKTALDRDIALMDPNIGSPAVQIAVAMRPDTQVPHDLLLRYETMYERHFNRALRQLCALQGHPLSTQSEPFFPTAAPPETVQPEDPEISKRTQQPVEFSSPNLDLAQSAVEIMWEEQREAAKKNELTSNPPEKDTNPPPYRPTKWEKQLKNRKPAA